LEVFQLNFLTWLSGIKTQTIKWSPNEDKEKKIRPESKEKGKAIDKLSE